MSKLAIGEKVVVQGYASQWPFERVVDTGVILCNKKGYLVALDYNRENLIFKRRELSLLKD